MCVLAVLACCAAGSAVAPPALGLGRAPLASPEVGIEDQGVISGPLAPSIVPVWRAMGVDSVRIQAFWDGVSPDSASPNRPAGFNPADPNDPQYNWAALDRAISIVLQNGMRVNLTINQCNPRWASDEPANPTHCWRPNSQQFAQFAGAVGRRYGSSVNRYLLGSEPNQLPFLAPQYVCAAGRCTPEAPHRYRNLLNAAYPALKAADPTSQVLIGELAPIGSPPSPTSGLKPLTFIRELACTSKVRYLRIRTGACATFVAPKGDAFGYHPYVNNRKPPTFQIRDTDIAKIGDIPRLLGLLDNLSLRGRLRPSRGRKFSVYFTEYGYISNPPSPRYGVSLAQQARYNAQSAYRVWQYRSRIKLLSQYLWQDDATFATGLLLSNGAAKPALADFMHPFFIDGRRRLATFWGQVRPDAQRTVELQIRLRRSAAFRTIRRVSTNAGGYWVVKLPAVRFASYRYVYRVGTTAANSLTLPAPALP
jgi:hypothetical protein